MRPWIKKQKMNKNLKWTDEKRTMAAIKKAKPNEDLNKQFEKYQKIIYDVFKDVELVHNVYLRLTIEYNPNNDFMQQFTDLYRKLKRIKLIDYQKQAATWVELLESRLNDSDPDYLESI